MRGDRVDVALQRAPQRARIGAAAPPRGLVVDHRARQPWRRVQDAVHHGVRIEAVDVDRACAAGKLAQQHAERVDVGRDADRVLPELFRGGRMRRQEDTGRGRLAVIGRPVHDPHRDAEVEQLGEAVVPHQHVGRLDVAMHDELCVCVLDGGTDVEEEREAGAQRQRTLVAMARDRRAFDVLHREIRGAVLCGAGVDEARDVRVLQRGEQAVLAREARRGVGAETCARDEFERDPLRDRIVVAFGEVDHAHAAAREFPHDAECAEAGSGHRLAPERVDAGIDAARDAVVAGRGEIGVGGEQPLDQRAQLRFPGGRVEQSAAPLGVVEVDAGVEEIACTRPARRFVVAIHVPAAGAPGSRRACSHARANCQERLTVRSDTSSTSPTSGTVSPAK
ncbi:hypothetical protein FHW12_001829 [Dokdonella fugitiva]|uniref:Uncharacterized protein n=1 Tax=Dokdonella fugitiva TaxID=328517 RepID=A0A839EV46_9GAMM|nr:hypothetical protein [Dokdonella fugitiva]